MSIVRTLLRPVARRLRARRLTGGRNELRRAYESLLAERDELRRACGAFPPGHFYSPIPCWDEIRRDEATIWGEVPRTVPGVDMREAEQLALLESFAPYYESMPFKPEKTEGLRYYFENPAYSYSDAICLHCMIRHARPKRIVEIGSGFSSCVTLDTNERFFNNSVETTFIEPYPELLTSLLKEGDEKRIRIIPQALQKVGLHVFRELEAGDIVFVDSTHVSKIDSDVNRVFFSILPMLAPGVYIHFHDIFFPFEYPKDWVNEGRAWSEAYLLHSFLQYNSEFHIVLMITFMSRFYEDFFREKMPLCLKNRGGNLWIQKRSVQPIA